MLIFMIRPAAFCKNLITALDANPIYWGALLGFCLIPHGVTYGFMQESLKRVEATIYQILMALDPVTALILGVILFGQSVRIIQIIGICIVLAAVLFINVMEGREENG
ncbi:MAG: EamA family transporter [Lachnospiraceae bacterium]|nr:EamA family transporter [Lachnospiraceae bacterium]